MVLFRPKEIFCDSYEEICITHGVFAHRYDGCRRKEQKESAAAAKANE